MRRLIPCPSCGRHVFSDSSSCAHCGSSDRRVLLALAVAASLGAACEASPPPPVAVYGPPMEPTNARSATPVPSAVPTASEAVPPQPPAPVYGPPPQVSTQRLDTSAAPSSSAQPPRPPPVGVYGPAPQSGGIKRLENDPLK